MPVLRGGVTGLVFRHAAGTTVLQGANFGNPAWSSNEACATDPRILGRRRPSIVT